MKENITKETSKVHQEVLMPMKIMLPILKKILGWLCNCGWRVLIQAGL
jgi:hypothetical protein